ncbi:hypothetical protein EC960497_A0088 [Escherichia coli 96.0497]|nr:hypothetical protein EC960497_A0088 [Escherichia coli 96.0497]
MPGMSFQAGLWCASCKSDSCSYQRDQKQPDGRKSHEHLLIFNHLFSLRYISIDILSPVSVCVHYLKNMLPKQNYG